MTNSFDRLVAGDVPSGIYLMDMGMRPSSICHGIAAQGLACSYVDGGRVYDKESLLSEIARAMAFPDYYGHNWDALEECITELTWLEGDGYVLLYDHVAVLVAQHPDVWTTFYDVLQSAVDYWTGKSRPFHVLLRNTGQIPQLVPAL